MTDSVGDFEGQVDELDYRLLEALRGDDDGDGPLDHACPLCGPGRSSEYNQQRPVLRTWRPSPDFITYYCARCGAQGFARFEAWQEQQRPPLPKMPPPRKPTRTVDLRYVERLWDEATPVLPNFIIAYFRERGIDIKGMPSGVLRYHPQCPWEGRKTDCLLARYTDAVTGEARGLWRRHITGAYPLKPESRRPVNEVRFVDAPPKPMTLGPSGGCVIRLFPVRKRLVLAEGIETALSAPRLTFRGAPLSPVWASGSAVNMQKFPVLDGVKLLIVVADNDASGVGQAAAEACVNRWRAAGREAICLMPKQKGCDLNDVLMRKL